MSDIDDYLEDQARQFVPPEVMVVDRLESRVANKAAATLRLGALALSAALLVACDPHVARANGRLGVSLRADGRIEIVRSLCTDELAKEVKLLLHPGTVIGDSGDEVVWDIRSRSGSPEETFVVGQVPPMFAQEVAFNGPLSAVDDLGVVTETNQAQAVVGFRLDQLSQNMIFSQDALLTREQFQQTASSACAR